MHFSSRRAFVKSGLAALILLAPLPVPAVAGTVAPGGFPGASPGTGCPLTGLCAPPPWCGGAACPADLYSGPGRPEGVPFRPGGAEAPAEPAVAPVPPGAVLFLGAALLGALVWPPRWCRRGL